MLYKNHHITKLAKKWYSYYRIVRKHGDLTFTIQYVRTEIEKNVHTNDIQLARGQKEWDIDPTLFRRRKQNILITLLTKMKGKAPMIQVLLQNYQ